MGVRRQVRVVAVAVTLAFGLVGAAPARSGVTYPAPGRYPPVSARTLPERYAATQMALRDALAVARDVGDRARIAALRALEGRNLLDFDARGNGRVVEVIGDLARADRIVIVVPGSHARLDTFSYNRGPGGGARALAEEVERIDPEARIATVAWLGYDAPQGIGIEGLTDGLAESGAEALQSTMASLLAVNSEASISVLCHSYGSVVCGTAAPGLPVADLIVFGSPGMCASSVAALDTSARVWAGRSSGDWIRFVPSLRVGSLGFGTDPMSPEFGARRFPAGDGGHGDYLLPGGEALRSMAQIALYGDRAAL